MKDFIKKSSWSLASIVVKSAGTLIINKIFAVQYGTNGITLLAHFQNLISLVTQIPNDGINRGIIKYWSGKDLNQEAKQTLLFSGLIMNLLAFLVATLFIFLFQNYFFRDFELSFSTNHFILIVAGALLLFILHLFLTAVILSYQQIRIYAIINIFTSLIIALSIYIISIQFNLEYALLSFILSQSTAFLFSLIFVIKKRYIKITNATFTSDSFKKLTEFVLMALSVLLFGKLTDFIIRDYAIQQFGLHQTGLWQSVVKISDSYMMLFINSVGIVFYPQVSALIFDTEQLRKYLRDVLRIVIVVSSIGLVFIYLARYPILSLLYSKDFLAAADLIPAQLIGDFFCFIAYLLSYIISAQARTRTFVLLQAGSAFFYIGLVYLFTHFHGIMGLPVAHAFRYGILVIILIILNKRILF